LSCSILFQEEKSLQFPGRITDPETASKTRVPITAGLPAHCHDVKVLLVNPVGVDFADPSSPQHVHDELAFNPHTPCALPLLSRKGDTIDRVPTVIGSGHEPPQFPGVERAKSTQATTPPDVKEVGMKSCPPTRVVAGSGAALLFVPVVEPTDTAYGSLAHACPRTP
jgi:hypothetical protein